MIMEFVDGDTLKEKISEQPIPVSEAIRITTQVAEGLGMAHARGILHRDLKPENVMLNEDGMAILMDFGIARIIGSDAQLTQTGMSVGTPAYMSPEQITGESEIGPACDIYALGILLFEMLTGSTPFKANTPVAVMMKAVQDPMPMPSALNAGIPDALENIVLKSTAKQPEDRYATVEEMIEALQEVPLGERDSEAQSVSHEEPIESVQPQPRVQHSATFVRNSVEHPPADEGQPTKQAEIQSQPVPLPLRRFWPLLTIAPISVVQSQLTLDGELPDSAVTPIFMVLALPFYVSLILLIWHCFSPLIVAPDRATARRLEPLGRRLWLLFLLLLSSIVGLLIIFAMQLYYGGFEQAGFSSSEIAQFQKIGSLIGFVFLIPLIVVVSRRVEGRGRAFWIGLQIIATVWVLVASLWDLSQF